MELRTTERPNVAVVGGAGVEVSFTVPSFPAPGETVYSGAVAKGPGGRAIAVASGLAALDCRVFFLSAVGLDQQGVRLLASLKSRRINVDYVEHIENAATKTMHVLRDSEGSAARVVPGGAISNMSRSPLFSARAMISSCQLIVLLPDIPEDTFRFALEVAQHYRVPVAALATPPDRIPAPLIPAFDVLIVNPAEALALTRVKVDTLDGANEALNFLLKRGAGAAALYLGRQGAAASSGVGATAYFPAPKSAAPYTPASEDAFAAGLAAALTSGAPLHEAATFAVGYAAAAAANPSAERFPSREDAARCLEIKYNLK
jgi:ribokinase